MLFARIEDTREFAGHRGPALLGVALSHVALFGAALVLPMVFAHGAHFPSPFASAAESARYFAEHAQAVRMAGFLLFGSAVPLGIFAASTASRVQFLGIRVVSGLNIALFGGSAAALLLALSGMLMWVLGTTALSPAPEGSQLLHLLVFATGGPGCVVALGLFVAGIALTSGLQHITPRWLMFGGLASALVAELSWLSLMVPKALVLLPLARFSGVIWMLCVAALLPRRRAALGRPTTASASLGAQASNL
jgi:hypothetical protein